MKLKLKKKRLVMEKGRNWNFCKSLIESENVFYELVY